MKKTFFLALVAAISFSAIVQAQNIIGRFDYDSLHASNVLCTYGTYQYFNNYSSNYPGPYANVGIIDYGPNRYGAYNLPGSRHTVHTDTTQFDSVSNFNLRCIPQGSSSSVRLGCHYSDDRFICQAIAYTFTVDTSLSDMLDINFSVVMYNPGHHDDQQPRMLVEILDNAGNQLGIMNFTANNSSASGSSNPLPLNWQTGMPYNSSPITFYSYLDWNHIGINTRPYHGRTIKLRFTTFKCGQMAADHCAYTYYTVDYSNFSLVTLPIVAKSNEITFRAPYGFMKYEWRLLNSPSTVYDTLQTVSIPCGESFYCILTDYYGNTRVLYSESVPRRPHSDFSYTIENQNEYYSTLHLNNLSTLIDTVFQTTISEIEDFHWIIDQAFICKQRNPVINVSNGWHIISLITKSGSTSMSDTMTQRIYVSGNSGINTTEKAELKIYPNPAKDRIHIEGEAVEKVEVIDHIGRITMVEYGKNDINVAKLPAGNYILRMQTSDGQMVLRNFVKQ